MAEKEKTLSRHNEDVEVRSEEHASIDSLPPELIFQIVRNLEIKSLCDIKMTCNHLNELLDYDELYKQHCLELRSICPLEIDEDCRKGYSWQEILKRNYSKSIIKQQWMDGKFSNIASYTELPKESMCSMSVDSWGEILEAELTRDTQKHI